MILTFRPIKVRPETWKSAWTRRPRAPFGATYSKNLQDLDRELRHLGATDVFLQVETESADIRLDGQLRAGAKVTHPGALLTIETKNHGTLVYETDAFDHWQGNLRAITLGLEALRRIERYGIGGRGQQYAGYRELPAGTPLGPGMTPEEAAELLSAESIESPISGRRVWTAEQILADPLAARSAFKIAARKHHPDAGGDPAFFRRLTEARDLMKGAS